MTKVTKASLMNFHRPNKGHSEFENSTWCIRNYIGLVSCFIRPENITLGQKKQQRKNECITDMSSPRSFSFNNVIMRLELVVIYSCV